jgi:hypothetical protein
MNRRQHSPREIGYLGTVQHIAEDSLEQYAMDAFPESEAGPLEEHLLMCTACQDRLRTTDGYVAAMRAAAKAPVNAAKKKPAVKQMAAKKAAASAPVVNRASAR